MKKKNILFSFTLLLNILCGCGNVTSELILDSPTGGFPIIDDTHLFSDDYWAYVDILSVEKDYITEKAYFGFSKTYIELNEYRYLMVKCRVIEDFNGRYEEGTIITVPFVHRDYLKNVSNECLESLRNWVEQLDKLVVKCIPEREDYYEIIESHSCGYVNEETGQYYFCENLMKVNRYDVSYMLALKDEKLDLHTYYTIMEKELFRYYEIKNGLIYDGMTEKDFVDFLRNNIKNKF